MSNHPITPTSKLIEQWVEAWLTAREKQPPFDYFLATQAARWGADQELEECCEWLETYVQRWAEWSADFCAARRPRPPSLKEQALEQLRQIPIDPEAGVSSFELDIIRRALEQLPDE